MLIIIISNRLWNPCLRIKPLPGIFGWRPGTGWRSAASPPRSEGQPRSRKNLPNMKFRI